MSASEPWCEDCEAHHDKDRHTMLMAIRALRERRVKSEARNARICETARAIFIRTVFTGSAAPYEITAGFAIAAAKNFESCIDEFLGDAEGDES